MTNLKFNLFVPTGGHSDVVLNWVGKPTEKFDSYAEAYHLAARRLFEKSTQEDLRDIGACPVVFLYRHALELYLKEILINGQKILQLKGKEFRTVKQILDKHGHKLSSLWKALKKLHKQLDWEWEEQLDANGKIIQEFDMFDPESSSFRFPVTKRGDAALSQHFRFDLCYFCERLDKVIAKLEEISCGVAGVFDEMNSIE
jgi:hypothetical protein